MRTPGTSTVNANPATCVNYNIMQRLFNTYIEIYRHAMIKLVILCED